MPRSRAIAAGVQRAGAAEREQHEVAEVVAAHGGDGLDRLLHLHVDDADDAFGGVREAEAERSRDLRLDAPGGLPASSFILPPRKLSSPR